MNLQINHFLHNNSQLQTAKNKRTWIEINKQAILHNLEQFKSIIGPSRQLAVVAKSNAYGHGLQQMVQIFQESNAVDWLCIFALSEALIARENGFKKPILVLGYADIDLQYAIISSIDLTVYSLDYANSINEVAKQLKQVAYVHIKVDTGLSRLGLNPAETFEMILEISKMPFIKIRGIFSHFAESDANDQAFTNKQLQRFNELITKLKENNINIAYMHSSNTAGIIRFENCHFNFVRTGGGTYGMYKSAAIDELGKKKYQLNLKLAINWKSRVMQIKDLPTGTYVSYARTFMTYRPTKVAIIPIGYWDGYNRGLSSKGMIYIKGQPTFVLGRVCMNMIIVDITDTKDIAVGDEAIIIGDMPGIRPDDIAQASGSINYEVTTRINPGIERIIV